MGSCSSKFPFCASEKCHRTRQHLVTTRAVSDISKCCCVQAQFSEIQWGELGLWDPRGLVKLLSPKERPQHSQQPWTGQCLGWEWFVLSALKTSLCAVVAGWNVGTLLLESSYCKGCPLDFNGGDCKWNGTNKIICIAPLTSGSLLFALAASAVAAQDPLPKHCCSRAQSAVTQGRVCQGVQVGTELQATKGLLCEWKSLQRGRTIYSNLSQLILCSDFSFGRVAPGWLGIVKK